jgi:hypothetical protein
MIFALMAIRNVAPALEILGPLVAARLCLAFPTVGRRPEPRWSAPLGVVAATVMVVAGLLTVPGRAHLPSEEFPVQLAARIGELSSAQRVLNDYNAAGLVLFFAKPTDQVAIDGRTDRYGADYIGSYVALEDVKGEWAALLDRLDPTVALLKADGPLAHVLVAERGWQRLGASGDWVLLQEPATSQDESVAAGNG